MDDYELSSASIERAEALQVGKEEGGKEKKEG